MKLNIKKLLSAMLLGVLVYGGFALWSGLGKMRESLSHFEVSAFFVACALAFGNYLLRYLKWEFYLARLAIRGVGKVDSFLTFLSGFVLTVTPGKIGEVFKSYLLHQSHGVPMARTAPIVVAERATDVLGIVVLIVAGSMGFSGGLLWAGIGGALVAVLIGIVSSRKLSLAIIDAIGRLPGKVGAFAPKLHESYESLATMLAPQNLIVPTLLSIGAWMLECLSLWVIVRGFAADVSVALAAFFYATSTLAGAIIPVPGGLGVTESALLGQLTQLGHIQETTATASMILVRFATLWFAVLVGFVALTLLRRRYPDVLGRAEPDTTSAD